MKIFNISVMMVNKSVILLTTLLRGALVFMYQLNYKFKWIPDIMYNC